ncbi:MAG TPA: hypothetical protein VGD59_08660 [Acidisarcina sp.]
MPLSSLTGNRLSLRTPDVPAPAAARNLMAALGSWLVTASLAGAITCAAASFDHLPAPRFPVSRATVALALTGAGSPTAPYQVAMLSDVIANREDPTLVVLSISPWNGSRTRVELGCRAAVECLPFYVLVTWADRASAEAAVAELGRSAALRQQSPVRELDPASSRLPDTTAGNATTVLRAGAHATLAIDADGVHIRLAVVCLEGGPAGSRIRVRSADGRRLYVAEVLDGASLKGTL